MSWVKITNGVITTKVPKQSFVDLYQKNGFTVVVENNPTDAPENYFSSFQVL